MYKLCSKTPTSMPQIQYEIGVYDLASHFLTQTILGIHHIGISHCNCRIEKIVKFVHLSLFNNFNLGSVCVCSLCFTRLFFDSNSMLHKRQWNLMLAWSDFGCIFNQSSLKIISKSNLFCTTEGCFIFICCFKPLSVVQTL